MRLVVPFVYSAKGVRPRCRKPEDARLIGREEFDVPELPASRAPVAVRVRGGLKKMFWEDVPEGFRDLKLRALGGELMRHGAVRLDNAEDRAHHPWEPLTPDTAQAVLDLWARQAAALPNAAYAPFDNAERRLVGRLHDEREWHWQEHLSDDRAERAAALRDTMSRAAFVDGLLHVPTKGPLWKIGYEYERDPNGHYGRVVRSSVVPDAALVADWKPEYKTRLFPYTDLAGAEAAVRRIEARAHAPVVSRPTRADIELLRPDLIGASDEDRLLREAATGYAAMMRAKLGVLGSGTIRLYADLVDAIDAATLGQRDAEASSALLDALERVDAALTAENNGRVPGGTRNPLRLWREATGRAAADPAAGAVALGADELRAIGLMR
jgi:hypothetical protein